MNGAPATTGAPGAPNFVCVVCRTPVEPTAATFDGRFGVRFTQIPKGPCMRPMTSIHPHCGQLNGQDEANVQHYLLTVPELLKLRTGSNSNETITRMRQAADPIFANEVSTGEVQAPEDVHERLRAW